MERINKSSNHVFPMPNSPKPLVYPQISESSHIDNYHGTLVADPYQGLEDKSARSNQALGGSAKPLNICLLRGNSD